MIFKEPVSFHEAMQTRAVQRIMPTDLLSKMLAELPREIRERAVFSAGVQNGEFLQRTAKAIDAIVAGDSDRATQRADLRQLADLLGLEQLTSDSRLNLILDTNTKMSHGFGSWVEGQHPSILSAFPAQELYRAEDRKEPRDWPSRWAEAGGQFFPGDSDYPEGRMIALKNDPIWEEISEFGLPYAPFDYNSGMDVKDVDYDEAVELGLIDEGETEKPEEMGLNDGLQMSPGIDDPELEAAVANILEGIARFTAEGIVKFIGAGS